MGADRPQVASGSMRPYLEAKAEADRYLMASGLEYTILRPGSLTDGALLHLPITDTGVLHQST
jgi:uncharacterized protein YbjT (DUF2867 family)